MNIFKFLGFLSFFFHSWYYIIYRHFKFYGDLKMERNNRGLYFKTVRIYKKKFKREICDACGITIQSVTKIEDSLNYLSISSSTDKKWQKALEVSISNDYEKTKSFYDDYADFIEHCMFCLRQEAKSLFNKKYQNEEEFVNYEFFPNYLLIRFIYLVLFEPSNDECNDLFEILDKISNHLTGRNAQIYYLYAGIHKKNLNQLIQAKEYILQSKNMGSDALILGMDYYQLSILCSKNNQNLEALMHTIQAKNFFEKTNNFIRTAQCISHMAVIFIHLNNYNMAEIYCNDAIAMATRLKNNNILGVNYGNLSWIALINEQYDEVHKKTALAFEYGRNDLSFYFQNAFAYLKKEKYDEAQKWVRKGIDQIKDRTRLYYKTLRMIEKTCDNPELKEEYLEAVVKQIDDKKQQHDIDLIQLLYQELIACKKEKRKLDEAFIYYEAMDHFRKENNRG